MERRRFLELGVSVGAAGLLAGCGALSSSDGSDATPSGSNNTPKTASTPGAEGQTTPGGSRERSDSSWPPESLHGVEFETVKHAVDDIGMDPTGEEPIDATLDEALSDGTLVAFPPGKYLATDEHTYEDVARVGLVGLGETKREVQFVFPPGNEGAPDPSSYRFLHFDGGRDIVVQNLTFQMTDDKKTGVETAFTPSDGLWLVDVEFAGFFPDSSHAPGFNVIAHITDRDGVGVIRRFVNVGGGVVGTYPHRGTPIGVFKSHVGELRIEDAHIEESGSHSMYASHSHGCVRVEGGVFRNNDNTNLRLSGGGHPSKQSWIKGARVEIDVDEARHLPRGERYEGIRGIWVEAKSPRNLGYGGLIIEDVDAVVRSNGRANDLPLLLIGRSHGSVTVRNCRFRSATERVEPVDVRAPDRTIVDGSTEVTIEDTVVETSAYHVIDEGAALSITGRPRSHVRGTSVRVTDGWVDGIYAKQVPNLTITGCTITSGIPPTSGTVGQQQISGDEFGWNSGLVIRESDECRITDVSVSVPGSPLRISGTKNRKLDITTT